MKKEKFEFKSISKSKPSRKLKRKSSLKKDESWGKIEKAKKAKEKVLKLRKIYKKQKCAHIKKDGTKCNSYACGKSTLCEAHGGEAIIKENLIKDISLKEDILPQPQRIFEPALHPIQYIEMARNGLSDVEIAAEFEISLATLKQWVDKYESFYIAYDIGKAMHEAWWLRQGKENMNERSFNTNLFKYMTMNKLGYSDKIEQKSLNMNVHGVLMVPDAVSEDEWEKEALDV